MTLTETTLITEKYRERCEDRVDVFHTDERTVIVVADGAGGIGSGDLAAESIVRQVKSNFETIHSADEWANFLRQIDKEISAGESTAVVVDIRPYGIAGASVGDSQAWIIMGDQITNLTNNQIRKPLIGSGKAQPLGFTHKPLNGLMIAATDGFFDYAKRDDITRLVNQTGSPGNALNWSDYHRGTCGMMSASLHAETNFRNIKHAPNTKSDLASAKGFE